MKLNNTLSGKQFLTRFTIFSIGIIIVLISFNTYFDIYGLFRDSKGRELPIYYNERITKFLMSYDYIPTNYNTILVGTSLSDNLDFGEYRDIHSVYNASIMGANISEVKDITLQCVSGGVQNVIICISPYQFKNSGAKEVELGAKLFFSALGSLDLYQTYAIAMIRYFDLMPNKYPKDQFDQHGVNDYGKLFQVSDVKSKIQQEAKEHNSEEIVIDELAMEDFRTLIKEMDNEEVNYMVYLHPIPSEVFEANKKYILQFQQKLISEVSSKTTILNFNDGSFDFFVSDYSNYIDHGHLSKTGQKQVVDRIYEKMVDTLLFRKKKNNI